MSHEKEAAALAEQYAGGDQPVRDEVAQQCEEQGILAALVAERLREKGLQKSFVDAMKRSAGGGRSR